MTSSIDTLRRTGATPNYRVHLPGGSGTALARKPMKMNRHPMPPGPRRASPAGDANVTPTIATFMTLVFMGISILLTASASEVMAKDTAEVDSTRCQTYGLPGIGRSAQNKICDAKHLELRFLSEAGGLKSQFSHRPRTWQLSDSLLTIWPESPIRTDAQLIVVRTKRPPSKLAIFGVGIPVGIVLGSVAVAVFGEKEPTQACDGPCFDSPSGRDVAIFSVLTFVGGPILTYQLTNRWQTAYSAPK
jgi:hypothetical protein